MKVCLNDVYEIVGGEDANNLRSKPLPPRLGEVVNAKKYDI